MKLSIIIPVYNESQTVAEIIRQLKAVKGFEKEIIVVDDCSTDGTSEVIKDIKDIKVINHKKNQGKGAAIRTGIEAATGDYVLVQDADLEYDPQDILTMIK